jgi:hypothetical protein
VAQVGESIVGSRLLFRATNIREQHAEARQPILLSIYRSPSPEYHPEQQNERVELRFSFSQPAEEEQPDPQYRRRRNVFAESQVARPHLEKVLSQSFTNLSFEKVNEVPAPAPRTTSTTTKNFSRPPVDYTNKAKAAEAWARSTARQPRSRRHTPQPQPPITNRMPVIPELSKPKREGYGFSFSESAFYDSDEYPDTEVDFDPPTDHEDNSAPTPPSFPVSDRSFDDLVVVRDVGSFHLARPQRRLPCTSATREDTIRLKVAARNLLKYTESQDIYSQLVTRLERMVRASLQESGSESSSSLATATYCAVKLLNFLLKVKMERIETGEVQIFVEHEVEWAKWLVEASQAGVMHLRGVGCQCRPDWEEEE